jgi:hypothetical protein
MSKMLKFWAFTYDDRQPCPPSNIGTVTKIEISFIDHSAFKLKASED